MLNLAAKKLRLHGALHESCSMTTEARARQYIDQMLGQAGWSSAGARKKPRNRKSKEAA
jgi:hypothetical protein